MKLEDAISNIREIVEFCLSKIEKASEDNFEQEEITNKLDTIKEWEIYNKAVRNQKLINKNKDEEEIDINPEEGRFVKTKTCLFTRDYKTGFGFKKDAIKFMK